MLRDALKTGAEFEETHRRSMAICGETSMLRSVVDALDRGHQQQKKNVHSFLSSLAISLADRGGRLS